MLQVQTITLNPAYDLHYFLPHLTIGAENRATRGFSHAGGKGINLSRALEALGVKNRAYALLGHENCDDYLDVLETQELDISTLMVPGTIRSNITLHPADGPETRISAGGFVVSDSILDSFANLIAHDICVKNSFFAFCGSLPAGMTQGAVVNFLKAQAAAGRRVVIDSQSISVSSLQEIHPFLIKPNREELDRIFGISVKTLSEGANAAKLLVGMGYAEEVLVTLGELGAAWSNGTDTYILNSPVVEAVSTIGAGDSTIAGYLAGLLQDKSVSESLCMAVATGAATCLADGTLPPQYDDILRLCENIEYWKV